MPDMTFQIAPPLKFCGEVVKSCHISVILSFQVENATDEKTWYVKDAHVDTVQLTDSNKTALSNKQMQTGFGELRDELHQIVRIA